MGFARFPRACIQAHIVQSKSVGARTSIYASGYLGGERGKEVETSMYFHNWWVEDDSAHQALEDLVAKWFAWGIDMGVVVQLVSFVQVFSGKAVVQSLLKREKVEDIPIRAGQQIPDMQKAVSRFVANLMSSGKNPFSCRFRICAHNECVDFKSVGAKRMVDKLAREILLHIEAMSLAECKNYGDKLAMLSRVKGYSDNTESAFLGKN